MIGDADDPFADPFADPVVDPFAEPSDPLLAPIPGDDPAGEDLRYDPVYDRIQEARRDEDSTAPQGIWTVKLKKAEWADVRDEASAALRTRTKDLQLAAWLMEAWLQLEGMPGLVRGLRLITALSERFWASIHPKQEADDPESRLAPFYWIETRMPERVGQVLVTGRHGPEDAALSWQAMGAAQRLEAMATGSAAEEYKQAVAAGALTLPAFVAAVRATPVSFYEALAADGQVALSALAEMVAALDRLCGLDSPRFSAFQASIEQVVHFARRTLADRGVSSAPPPRAAAPAVASAPAVTAPSPPLLVSGGAIRSREHAYELLAQVADWLAVAEPHSPTPFLIRRAISWGGMGLSELLVELVDETSTRRTIQRLLQIPED